MTGRDAPRKWSEAQWSQASLPKSPEGDEVEAQARPLSDERPTLPSSKRQSSAGVSADVGLDVAETKHRDDLQGLRAIAVLLVVLDHAGVTFFGGGYVGVDVFFVLSGFLITGLLLSGAAERGRVSFTDFYARRARRILPAAALTLIATDIAAYLFLNYIRAKQVMLDSVWASFFAANIHFSREAVNYFAQGQPTSPLQHVWSLSVEEQFYVVWPALLSLVLFGVALRRRSRRGRERSSRHAGTGRPVTRLLVVIIVASVASLAWSIHDTSVAPAAAYFSTFARAWELGLGAALAIAAVRLERVGALWCTGMGWLGLVAIAVAALTYSAATPFPGYAALLPTVGCALVIAAGIGGQTKRGVGRLLALGPLGYVGDRSYAFYLWHWPVLIIVFEHEGHAIPVWVNLLLVAGAFGLSVISYRFFENPLRRKRWRPPARALVLWPASLAAVIGVAALMLTSIDGRIAVSAAASQGFRPPPLVVSTQPAGSTTVAPSSTAPTSTPFILTAQTLPAVIQAVAEAARGAPIPSPLTPSIGGLLKSGYFYPPGCTPQTGQTTSSVCGLGDVSASRTIVVLGDSIGQMWVPTLIRIGQEDSWVVRAITKFGCEPDSWLVYPEQPECPAWYKWAVEQAKALHPAVTVITGNFANSVGISEAEVGGIEALATTMERFSKHVMILADPPNQNQQPIDCLLADHATMKSCTTPVVGSEFNGANAAVAAFADNHGDTFIDTIGWFCHEDRCPLVINHTITRWDEAHMTEAYAVELAGPLQPLFQRALTMSARSPAIAPSSSVP